MNEKELFDALIEDCPNELKKHDVKVRKEAIEEIVDTFEALVEEVENLYGRETELTKRAREMILNNKNKHFKEKKNE